MSILSKLFGRGPATEPGAQAIDYKDFRVTPDPMREGKHFRIAATIEAEIDGETKTHRLIRADTLESHEAAVEASLAKAKQMIDQMGARLFD